ncbi:hypothetical protein N7462_011555 [Penicillium macrosclerotiorum]|uniref:uncharacterized protein n=1 Tax=Penicillium macrosclerotiorum TaxID=303699 RepID=UPI0025466448|nr:uncharacterized protein N7462_011555 [Penicillium macrosclerotiorum]KAJ5664742.1 hypothetical protein N7462_011555 [Penicillium macrosclerotiorum]
MGQSRWGLAPWIVLGCAASTAWAGKRPFNIHDDLLAYPQYQVVFPEDYILDAQAEELLRTQTTPGTDDSSHTIQKNPQVYTGTQQNYGDSTPRGSEDLSPSAYTYEEMIMDDRRLLCQIPRVSPADHNNTSGKANELDEQKELARATDRGLELLSEMEGKCMYYFSGWWSYSFCYQKQIKQFHALPAGRGVPHYPPVEDPNAHSFILGQFAPGANRGVKEDEKTQSLKTDVAELHTKGGSRYLVQHLRGGTKCDLTGRDRRVEVQFHCHPQSTDQIGWIKELTTCSYLMQDEVHNIECREILFPEDVPEWEAVKEWYLAHQLTDSATDNSDIQIVGGIEVGGQKLVGMEGKVIEKGRVAFTGEERAEERGEMVAKRENGEVKRASKQVLKKYDLDPEKVEDMKKRLEEIAKGKDWTLEVVETNGVIKFQGIVEPEDDDEEAEGEDKKGIVSSSRPPRKDAESPQSDNAVTPDALQPESRAAEDPVNRNEEETEGSEETFKDEL